MRMRLLLPILALVAALAAAGYWWFTQATSGPQEVPLTQQSLPQWSALLGGESGISKQRIDDLNRLNSGLEGESLKQARDVATASALSDLTGVAYGLTSFDAPSQGTVQAEYTRCAKVKLLAQSLLTAQYDGQTWAKALVLFSGECKDGVYTRSAPGVVYAYELLTDAGWVPVRSWATPGAGQTHSSSAVDAGALVSLGPCGVVDGEEYQARPRVAVSFQRLCAAAKKDGVVLVVSSAWRSREEQRALFKQAVEAYGSEQEASRYVAPADDSVCASRHCSGLAVGVEPDTPAVTWLAAPATCLRGSSEPTAPVKGACPAGSTAASNAQTFGFATPPEQLPGYLEYVLPAGLASDGKADADCTPYGDQVPAVIASVFRCRLGEAGVAPAQTEQAVADALVVARCSSGLNPQATVFNGQWARTPKPGTGRTFPLGGLFALAPADSSWQSGSLADPVAAANYAAKLWLVDRSFSRFFCATGADSDLAKKPSISSFGGPNPAKWATTW